jgi:hypothetical protein
MTIEQFCTEARKLSNINTTRYYIVTTESGFKLIDAATLPEGNDSGRSRCLYVVSDPF